MENMKVRLTFTEPILGTACNDPNIHEEFIASKGPDAKSIDEEIEAIGVDGVIEKGKTVFPRDEEGRPILWDYQIKGFFKDSCGSLRKVPDSQSSKIKAYKKEIDGLIFPQPRKIVIHFDGEIKDCQRPLRGQTAQGERVALANSEEIPSGAWIEFEIIMLTSYRKAVMEWLDYGRFRGIGQWRNSGKGRFVWEEIE